MQQTCMCWGICCGPGWDQLLEELCAKLHKLFTDAGLSGENYPAVAQVKEKFGTLRFYMNPIPENVADQAYAFIQEAENKSAVTCERCGAPGERCSDKGWLSTCCKEHAPKPGTKFHVYLSGVAHVTGSILINARNEDEARRLALLRTGDVEWKYDGIIETAPLEVNMVIED